MKKYSDLEYLKLSKWERFKYRFVSFFASIPVAIWHAILGIGGWFKKVYSTGSSLLVTVLIYRKFLNCLLHIP